MTQKRKRPQAPKTRSIETRDFLLQHRGSRIPSGKAYVRKEKYGNKYE